MVQLKKTLTFFSLLLFLSISYAQEYAPKERYLVDSLVLKGMYETNLEHLESVLDLYHKSNSEVRKMVLLDSLVNGFFDEQWVKYNELLYVRSADFLTSNKGKEKDIQLVTSLQANTLSNYGFIYNSKGNTELGLSYYEKALDKFKTVKDTNGILIQYNNLSILYQKTGEFIKSMEMKELHLKLAIEYGDPGELYLAYNNIGYDLEEQEYYTQAIENLEKALKYAKLSESIYSQAIVLNNLGSCYHSLGDDQKALEYYYKSIELREKDGRYIDNISPLINVAGIYREELEQLKGQNISLPQTKVDTTIKIIKEGIALAKDGNRVSDLSSLHAAYAQVLIIIDDVDMAVAHSDTAYILAQKNGFLTDVMEAAEARFLAYKAQGNIQVALEMHEKYITLKDEYQSNEKANDVIQQNYRMQYELKSAADSIKQFEELKVKNAEIAAEQAEKDSLKKQKYYLFGGLALVALFGVFMFNRFRVTRRQKDIIDEQRKEVEQAHEQLAQHHTEIQDSIKYAKRIQEAIMPSMSSMNEALKDGFVLYLPKDVVAGDFFWMEPVEDTVYFAAADCTGHGVPGAMVSVVCSNALTKALLEERVYDLGRLLDRTREIVVERLAKSGEEVKDGMDISICALNSKSKVLRWAGANNSLWILRKDDDDQVEEYKPNKQPIGKYEQVEPFTEHVIQLFEGDLVYVFTDGYADQFGGPKGKKLKSSQFKEILYKHRNESMEEQQQALFKALKDWQGSHEQLDDVCVIGVRV